MDSGLIAPLVTGGGVAGVFCVLFIAGQVFPKSVVDDKNREIAELKADRDAQWRRADVAVAAASATRDLLAAIQIGQQIAPRPSRIDP